MRLRFMASNKLHLCNLHFLGFINLLRSFGFLSSGDSQQFHKYHPNEQLPRSSNNELHTHTHTQNKKNRPLYLPREFHVRPGWRQTKQYNIVLVMNIAEALSN